MGLKSTISKIGKDVSTHMKRKATRYGQVYMAIEKAHKTIEDHKTDPVRAPMNVPDRKFTSGR